MKPEPAYDQAAILAVLRDDYGLPAARLDFVPRGFVSQGFMVSCDGPSADGPPADGGPERAFLKIWEDSRWGKTSVERLPFTHALAARLAELGLRTPRPLARRDGGYLTRLGGLSLALYAYIDGTPLDRLEPLPAAVRDELARALGRLHALTPRLGLAVPLVERFRPAWKATLLRGLDELETVGAGHRAGQRAFARLLLPEQARVRALLARMEELGERAERRGSPFVLCHTDLNGDNVFAHDDGSLTLLDWEGAILAPAEHDLFLHAWRDDFPAFLAAYRAEMRAHGAAVRLHPETFGYYFYHRNLEDLTDWFVTILRENTTGAEDDNDLEGVRNDCLAGWDGLEGRIAGIAIM